MVIILSARKCCEDQVSGNSESDHAASQTAKNKHAARRTFRKFAEMWDFARLWCGLVHRSSIQIKRTSAVSWGIRTILRPAQRSLQSQKISTKSAPARQFVRFSDRAQRLFPEAFCKPTEAFLARAISHPPSAPAGP